VIEKPGYDAASGLYAAFDPEEFRGVATRPDRNAASAALSKLEDVIKTFSFVSPADCSVAIAAILTGLSRHLFSTAPIIGFSAPVAGSGKSLLVDICSVIVTGHPAAVLSPGRTEEELEKRLGAAFIQGAAIISLDNCNEALSGAFLCQVLTQPRIRTRILGQSTIVEMPTNCLMLATGNNLTFADDMTRRAVLCTLDPGVERPEELQFTNDIVREVQSRRGELVIAGLTVLRAFHVAGRPCGVKHLGSFSEWSRFIRGSLVWLDRADPCETLEKVRDNDPILSRNLALLSQIDLFFGAAAFTTADLMEEALVRSSSATDGYGYKNKELHLVLSEFSGGRDRLNAVSIGKALSRLDGRICDKMVLRKLNGSGGKRQWQLVGGFHKGVRNQL
jgi:putative DNA primase/helicase